METTRQAWDASRSRARLLPAPALAARDEARELLDAARAEAEACLLEARAEAEALREAARDAGRDEGLAYAQRLLLELQRSRARMFDGEAVRAAAVELALAIARRVLGEAWAADPASWSRAVLAAAGPLRRSRPLTLRVPPGAVEPVAAQLAGEVARGEVVVEPDGHLDEAGCIALGECGRVDGRLSTMLDAFRGPLGAESPA